MPTIKPISDLRNNFNQISEICHKDGEPVFITKNGQGDLVSIPEKFTPPVRLLETAILFWWKPLYYKRKP